MCIFHKTNSKSVKYRLLFLTLATRFHLPQTMALSQRKYHRSKSSKKRLRRHAHVAHRASFVLTKSGGSLKTHANDALGRFRLADTVCTGE